MTRFTGTRSTISYNGVEIDGAKVVLPQDEMPQDEMPHDVNGTVTVDGELECDPTAFDWFNRWLRLARVLLSHFGRN